MATAMCKMLFSVATIRNVTYCVMLIVVKCVSGLQVDCPDCQFKLVYFEYVDMHEKITRKKNDTSEQTKTT